MEKLSDTVTKHECLDEDCVLRTETRGNGCKVHTDVRTCSRFVVDQRERMDSTVEEEGDSALKTQIGGSHYRGFKIQPFEFFHANDIPFHKADIIKRVLRYDLDGGGGLKDLNKIKHEVDLIIELGNWENKQK